MGNHHFSNGGFFRIGSAYVRTGTDVSSTHVGNYNTELIFGQEANVVHIQPNVYQDDTRDNVEKSFKSLC